jgi:hypothetical protein
VRIFYALEAKFFATIADDICLNHRWVTHSVLAARCPTEFSLLAFMNKIFHKILLVFFEVLLIQELLKYFIGNNHLARLNRTNA